jgi:hypothetical protein
MITLANFPYLLVPTGRPVVHPYYNILRTGGQGAVINTSRISFAEFRISNSPG